MMGLPTLMRLHSGRLGQRTVDVREPVRLYKLTVDRGNADASRALRRLQLSR
jgi:hypothetical protein